VGGHLYPGSFAEYTGHLAPAPKGQGHSFQSTKFYVLNIIYPTVQAPSCVSGSTSQEHSHIDNTQYQDCCTGDSWRRSESYPRWRVFELCSSEPLGGHPLFSGLLIQSYYQFTQIDGLTTYILNTNTPSHITYP